MKRFQCGSQKSHQTAVCKMYPRQSNVPYQTAQQCTVCESTKQYAAPGTPGKYKEISRRHLHFLPSLSVKKPLVFYYQKEYKYIITVDSITSKRNNSDLNLLHSDSRSQRTVSVRTKVNSLLLHVNLTVSGHSRLIFLKPGFL